MRSTKVVSVGGGRLSTANSPPCTYARKIHGGPPSLKPNSLGGMFLDPIGLTWKHDILVLKPSMPRQMRVKWMIRMGLDEWNSWFKSQVRDSNMSQDIVDLKNLKVEKQLKTI
ncbi:hypothetical protein TNCV_3580671 [Trichonephila clavipes]|nr:hypothetical protein TNCV_3580671 [Trichonephila clavipes]